MVSLVYNNSAMWVQRGENAARGGRTGEALEAIVELLRMIDICTTQITKNQLELEKAIQQLQGHR
jgi:hypothetical protein